MQTTTVCGPSLFKTADRASIYLLRDYFYDSEVTYFHLNYLTDAIKAAWRIHRNGGDRKSGRDFQFGAILFQISQEFRTRFQHDSRRLILKSGEIEAATWGLWDFLVDVVDSLRRNKVVTFKVKKNVLPDENRKTLEHWVEKRYAEKNGNEWKFEII